MLFFPGWIAEFACLCPSADLRRKLSLAGAFILFGSVACVSSVMLLMAQNEDLELLGAVVLARANEEAGQCSQRDGDEEEHRGIVDDSPVRAGIGFPTPMRSLLREQGRLACASVLE